MSGVTYQTPYGACQEFTANLAQAAATYDLCTASGDVLIYRAGIYVQTVGATFTSVSIQSNGTTAWIILSALDGALANIASQRSMPTTWSQEDPLSLRSGQKIQYTLLGATGTGSLRVQLAYHPITGGAQLT